MTAHDLTRRQALGTAGAMLAGSQIAPGPTVPVPGVQPAAERAGVPPRVELVNTLEYEEQAKRTLAPAVYSLIAGGDREGFERITIRPRVLVDTLGLDLSVTLFGERLFAPIVIGPVADQRRFHADGELATVKGASAARDDHDGQQPFERPAAGNCGAGQNLALVSGVRRGPGGPAADPGCGERRLQGDLHHGGRGAGGERVSAFGECGEGGLAGRRCAQTGAECAGARQGHRDAGGRTSGAAARRGRDHRVQLRRARGSGHGGCGPDTAGGRRRREWQGPGAGGRELPARHGHSQGAGLRRARACSWHGRRCGAWRPTARTACRESSRCCRRNWRGTWPCPARRT